MTYAFKAPRRPVGRVFVHCSDSDNPAHDDIAVIRRWHTSPDPKDPSKPWSDVGYSLFLQKDGTVQPGRDLERNPSAQKGHNVGTIAICLSGRLHFTDEQFDTLRDLARQISEQIPGVTFHPHRDVAPWKTCPNCDIKAILGLDEKGQAGVIRETTLRRPDGSIKLASLDDGSGCYLFVSETGVGVQLTLQFEEGGKPMGSILLSDKAVEKLAPLLAEIAQRNENREGP